MTPAACVTNDDVAAAATRLSAARRVLVTGLHGASADVVVAACDLAETIGAAIDAGDSEMARPTGPTIARAGEVTADREELRDRADLVIFWFCDPSAADSSFIERFVTPSLAPPLRRRVLAIGPRSSPDAHLHVELPREAAVDAARVLRHVFVHGSEAADGEPLVPACLTCFDAIEQASCVAIVTDHSGDPLGLEPWSVVHLIRTITHRKPAFEIPLSDSDSKTAATVLTWRYGAAGAIAAADREGGRFLPGEASAERLIDRGEVDCVVVVGGLAPHVAKALQARKNAVAVITLDDPDPARIKADIESITSAARGVTARAESGR